MLNNPYFLNFWKKLHVTANQYLLWNSDVFKVHVLVMILVLESPVCQLASVILQVTACWVYAAILSISGLPGMFNYYMILPNCGQHFVYII